MLRPCASCSEALYPEPLGGMVPSYQINDEESNRQGRRGGSRSSPKFSIIYIGDDKQYTQAKRNNKVLDKTGMDRLNEKDEGVIHAMKTNDVHVNCRLSIAFTTRRETRLKKAVFIKLEPRQVESIPDSLDRL